MTLAPSQTENLGSLFSKGLSFEVPPFQRKYSWTKKQAMELWDDIMDSWQDGQEEKDHFVGTICLLKKKIEGIKTQEIYGIIDGQQRVTTFYLLLKVLIERLNEDERDDIKDSIIGNKEEPRLTLSGNDKKWFHEFIFESSQKNSPDSKSKQRIKEVHDYFDITISSYSPYNIKKIITFMQEHLTFLVFPVDEQGQAIKMFSSINDRGILLKNLDKVKSVLMLYDNLYLNEELNNKINNHFESIFKAYDELFYIKDRLGVYSAGLLGSLDEDTVFIHHYMSSRHMFLDNWKSTDSAEKIYEKIKRQCYNKRENSNELKKFIDGYINDFDEFVNNYRKLLGDIEVNKDYEETFKHLELSRFLYPLVIRLYMAGKLKKLMSLLETVEMRVYKIRRNQSAADIYKLSSSISGKPDISLEEIRKNLKEFCAEHAENRYSFKGILQEGMYDNPATKYLVYSYNKNENEQKLSFDEYKKLEKEHVFPSEPNFEVSEYRFDGSDYEHEKHKIGNIALLEKNINEKVLNQAPVDKAVSYLDSKFQDTKNLGSIIGKEKNDFNKDKIDERGNKIINFSLERFKID